MRQARELQGVTREPKAEPSSEQPSLAVLCGVSASVTLNSIWYPDRRNKGKHGSQASHTYDGDTFPALRLSHLLGGPASLPPRPPQGHQHLSETISHSPVIRILVLLLTNTIKSQEAWA